MKFFFEEITFWLNFVWWQSEKKIVMKIFEIKTNLWWQSFVMTNFCDDKILLWKRNGGKKNEKTNQFVIKLKNWHSDKSQKLKLWDRKRLSNLNCEKLIKLSNCQKKN